MYKVSKTKISKSKYPELYKYLSEYCTLSRNLYNASLYRIRQNFTLQNKEVLNANELEVQKEIHKTMIISGIKRPKYLITYESLEKLMRVTENLDFFAGLPMQSAQATVKDACKDFKTWLKSLKAYKKDPSGFTGKPKMPGYKKSDFVMVKFTNQDCVLYRTESKTYLKFPKTKQTILLPHLSEEAKLKEVQIKPYYNDFLVITVYDEKVNTIDTSKMTYACGIDIGVNNLVALVGNDGSCLLYKGGIIKSANQWFNKQKAAYTSILDKEGKDYNTKKLNALSQNRDQYIKDYMHKVSSDIINYCITHQIGTIVIGKNKEWKQNINIGKQNNQTFTSIPFCILQSMIQYKAERVGIKVILQEESYTSKASFLDNDVIPTYKQVEKTPTFSGKRIKRGLYKSKNGTVINADLNGAANILRKALPNAFDNITDFNFFNSITVKNIKNINKNKSIPV